MMAEWRLPIGCGVCCAKHRSAAAGVLPEKAAVELCAAEPACRPTMLLLTAYWLQLPRNGMLEAGGQPTVARLSPPEKPCWKGPSARSRRGMVSGMPL